MVLVYGPASQFGGCDFVALQNSRPLLPQNEIWTRLVLVTHRYWRKIKPALVNCMCKPSTAVYWIPPVLTEGLRQAVDLLAVDVSLVPHKVIREVGGGRKPLPEQPALHGHHEVNLHQVERDAGVAEGHSQY